jgi:hypothetical protein
MAQYNSSENRINLRVMDLPTYLEISTDVTEMDIDDTITISGYLYKGGPQSTPIPIAGANIDLQIYISGTSGGNWLTFGNVITGSNGRFSIPWQFSGLNAVNYQLRALYGSIVSNIVLFKILQPINTVLTAAFASNEIYLGEDITINGRLVDEYGMGLSGMRIHIDVIEEGDFVVYTGSDGYFQAVFNTEDVGITLAGTYLFRLSYGGGEV